MSVDNIVWVYVINSGILNYRKLELFIKMPYEIDGVDFYTLSEIAELTNKSKQTIVRWYEKGKIPEPSRMASNDWRIYSADQKDLIVKFANKVIRSPSQGKLLWVN